MSSALEVLDPELREDLPEGGPAWRQPMLAVLTDDRFSDPGWLYEVKFDGVRALVVRDGDDVRVISRNEKLMNAAYPELVDAFATAGSDRYVVDGEIVAFEGGRTSFSRLQGRMGLKDPEKARRTGIAVYIYLFDILHLDGRDTTGLPLRERKSVLERAFEYSDPLRYSTHRDENGEEFFHEACRRGWEGLIAKRSGSPYRSGRSRDWLKFKCVRRQELVVAGFTDPRGTRTGFGALIVGYHDEEGLRYAGKVGTGYDEATLGSLRRRLDRLERASSPLADDVREPGAHWVEPELVAEIGFSEWTEDGRLRHPRFLGLREDKDPAEVVRESP